mmetsp:Transcript_4956/g.18427  ORF Transcript_4956/g.18427 Transcript_4956/m.18427 type:complete len:218 (-) Transcript_4956:1334-1987(-)
MPPATATFRLSISPGMGMETGLHKRSAVSDNPFPSLPSTKQTPFFPASCTATSAPTAPDAYGSAQYRTIPLDDVNSPSSSQERRAMGSRNTPPRAARSALSLNGSHVPGSSATASHPSASAVRVRVPKFPGSWMPSRARIRVAVNATLPHAPIPSIGGVASSATTSTVSVFSSPEAFLKTCAGARTTRSARIPFGSPAASSPRNTTFASGTPPAPVA